jgi:hypothetical protein
MKKKGRIKQILYGTRHLFDFFIPSQSFLPNISVGKKYNDQQNSTRQHINQHNRRHRGY